MKSLFSLLALLWAVQAQIAGAASASKAYPIILKPNPALPVTIIAVTFQTGSASDFAGQEGTAILTANTMREGGVLAYKQFRAQNREQIEDFLFPLASEIDVQVSKEQITFSTKASAKEIDKVFDLMTQIILAPAWNKEQFERIKNETLDTLKNQLPHEDEEELGKAVLDMEIFGPHHPYSHPVVGTKEAVTKLEVKELVQFHHEFFTQDRILVAATGVITPKLQQKLKTAFLGLPTFGVSKKPIPPSVSKEGTYLTIVKGPFDATGVHLGFEIAKNRASKDFPLLYLGNMAFGKHRAFVGRLMSHVREIRGLNYGAYSYVEDFPAGGMLLMEPTNVARSRQAFKIWARPSTLSNGCFLLRQIYREFISLKTEGITAGEFELTKSHLIGTAPLLAIDLQRQLGYAIDSNFYGVNGDYLKNLQEGAKKATLKTVNETLKNTLNSDHVEIVVVTKDPEAFRQQILGDRCGITYGPGIVKPAEILKEDEIISKYRLPLTADHIQILDSDQIF